MALHSPTEVIHVGELARLAQELLRAIEYYEHYETGTIRQIAQDTALKIALSSALDIETAVK